MNTFPPFSIVIVNYKSASRLSRLLSTLPSQHDGFSIIIVNNDPSESRVLSKLSERLGFLLIETGGNIGFAAGGNIGALAATGDIIGFLNPDMRWRDVRPHALHTLFDTEPHTGIIGLGLTDETGIPEVWSFGNDPSLHELLKNNLLPRNNSNETPTTTTDWVSGGALFIRKNLFQKLSGFDERFFLYFEDADLCLRARAEGATVRRIADMPIIHAGGKSQTSAAVQKRHFYTSQSNYFKKHRPSWEYVILRVLRFFRYGI
jgi:GT2 family glycosyltransferase